MVGLGPFIWVKVFQPEAYEAVSNTVNFPTILRRLNSYVFAQTVPGVFGINPALFTDLELNVGWGNSLRTVFSAFFIGFLGLAIFYRLKEVLKQLLAERFYTTQFIDIFVLTTLSTLAAYLISAKGGDDQYRFLLPIVCCFPFIVAYVIDRLSILVFKAGITNSTSGVCGF